MASVRTVHRLPAISRNGFVTTGGTNPLTRLGGGGGGGGRANAGEVTAVVDAGGGRGGGGGGGVTGDRRTLLGVGTYLIDTPKDTGLQLRQRYFSFQEQHRGQVVKSQDEELPEIPFRLKPETAFTAPSTTGPPPSVLMVDVATSPIFFYDDDDESVFGPSRSNSPSQGESGEKDSKVMSDAKDSNDVTDKNANDVINDVKMKTVSLVVKTSQGTSMGSMAHSVSFSERPRRKTPPRRPIRECSKVNPYSREGTTTFPTTASAHNTNTGRGAVNRETDHVAQRLPTLPDTARTNPTLDSFRRKSASVSDLTDIGSIFSWHDRDFELKTSRTVDVDSDNVGPTSYFQRSKSKSLLDLIRPSRGGGEGRVEENADDEVKALDLSAAYHKRLRIAHLAFRRENTLKHTNSLSKSGDNDKEWMDMVNTQVVDNDYDRYASRRKPVTPFAAKKPSKPFSPRSGTDFRLTHPPNGKMYPVFTTDGAPPKKFGKALYKRKGSKASSK